MKLRVGSEASVFALKTKWTGDKEMLIFKGTQYLMNVMYQSF